MTSRADNQIGNLCSDFHCSIVLNTFSKIHNFFISYRILLKLFLIGLSCFSAFIECELFLEWTCTRRVSDSPTPTLCVLTNTFCQETALLSDIFGKLLYLSGLDIA